jgi:putative ABC transport system permease protein
MTTLAPRAALRGPRNGGIAARRAVIRWARRMFRREWRQQLLILTLLTVAVAAAVGSITIAYNAAPADDAEIGSANSLLRFDGTDPRKLEAGLAAAKRRFGTTDVIGHRSVAIPGSVETIDFRAQDPHGAYGRDLLALHSGRYPAGPREVAVTDGVARLLRLNLRATLPFDGPPRTVVGIVENPHRLGDEFALVAPSSLAPDRATVLVDADAQAIDDFVRSMGARGDSAFAGSDERPTQRAADTLAMFSVATVFLLLASLVAAAGFAVVAQRRLRQLGMLAAVGATRKHLRLVLVAHGAIVGAIATLLGTIAGLGLWLAAGPTLESAVDHRIDRLSLPWALIAMTIAVSILGAIAAAWWPARTVARHPVMLALSGRPPKPRPARHAAIAAAALIAAGIGCLVLSDRDTAILIVAGTLATIVGCLLLGPPTIRVFSGVARRLSIAPRLALRDLVRYQARSGAALAAVTLALGIAATIVIIASAEQAKQAAKAPNLSDRQLRIYLGPPEVRELIPPAALKQVDRLGAGVSRLAARLDRAAVIPLSVAREPDQTPIVVSGGGSASGSRGFAPLQPMRKYPGPSYRPGAQLFVATPAVLRYLGIDPATIDPRTDLLADRSVSTGRLLIPSFVDRREFRLTNVRRIDVGRHLFGSDGVMPGRSVTFITPGGLRRLGWQQIPAGWMVETRKPLTSDQIADARAAAADAGLTIEARKEKPSYAQGMAIAIAAGALLALGILALTVGLIRGESAADLRTLTATGASSRIRRTLSATTAGALALLGTLIGVAGAYVVLMATYYDHLGYLSHVPVLHLVLAAIGVPVAAIAAGWLLAGREPPAIARAVIE